MDENIRIFASYALPVIFAVTLHEAAHGYVARFFGDDTAWRLGRISLNPLRHIDPIGTVLVPGLLLLTGGILFGWAKPVPVSFGNLRHPKRDMLWVAAAGPAANLVMAFAWAFVLKLALVLPPHIFTQALAAMGEAGIGINLSLMLLNLLPIPPLDGGRIVVSLLPMRAAMRFAGLERYGFVILLILLFTNILGSILHPLMYLALSLISAIFNI